MTKNKNGFPATGAIHLGISETTDRSLVPSPPAKIIASLIMNRNILLPVRSFIDPEGFANAYGWLGWSPDAVVVVVICVRSVDHPRYRVAVANRETERSDHVRLRKFGSAD